MRCQTIQVISLIRGINFDRFHLAVSLVTCYESAELVENMEETLSIRSEISFFLLSRLMVQFYGQSNRLLLPQQALQKRVCKSSSLLQIMSIQKSIYYSFNNRENKMQFNISASSFLFLNFKRRIWHLWLLKKWLLSETGMTLCLLLIKT